jgi:putative transposase
MPHHIVQRGNRQQPVFFCDADRFAYLKVLRERCAVTGARCLAYCLMDNHIHLILVPLDNDGLRTTLAPLHTRFANRINRMQGWSGHLFEGRYWSYPMDDAHLMQAVRYVENNPVKAGLVKRAEDWRWSSAAAHVGGTDDGLTDMAALSPHVSNWRAYLADGVNAADRDDVIEQAMRTGRPLGQEK